MKGMVTAFMDKVKKSRAAVKAEEKAKAAARARIVAQIEEMGIDLKEHQILLADGFEDAFIGVVERCARAVVACYDKEKCLEILEKDGMEAEDALEYFEYNVIGAWMGDYTPVFLTRNHAPALVKMREKLRRPAPRAASEAASQVAAEK